MASRRSSVGCSMTPPVPEVYEDQVRSIEGKGTTAPGQIDFALLTDGLRAEREQGITIDVAYRYFSTAKRKFIIADTPGHEQYTRNMATGASTAIRRCGGAHRCRQRRARADSVTPPRIYRFAAARAACAAFTVNKMDLVGYNEATFTAIERDFYAASGSNCRGYRQSGEGSLHSGERAGR